MYDTASKEPLNIIRVNECDSAPGLVTSRFQALWNEIERLRMALNEIYHATSVEMLGANYKRSGTIAHEIAMRALEK